jgi:hypothetical protein
MRELHGTWHGMAWHGITNSPGLKHSTKEYDVIRLKEFGVCGLM